AMIAGMVPMALGLGEGGEQTAPLGRAVIGGLLIAPFATLFLLPSVFTVVLGRGSTKSPPLDPHDPASAHHAQGKAQGQHPEQDGGGRAQGPPQPPEPYPEPRSAMSLSHRPLALLAAATALAGLAAGCQRKPAPAPAEEGAKRSVPKVTVVRLQRQTVRRD